MFEQRLIYLYLHIIFVCVCELLYVGTGQYENKIAMFVNRNHPDAKEKHVIIELSLASLFNLLTKCTLIVFTFFVFVFYLHDIVFTFYFSVAPGFSCLKSLVLFCWIIYKFRQKQKHVISVPEHLQSQ